MAHYRLQWNHVRDRLCEMDDQQLYALVIHEWAGWLLDDDTFWCYSFCDKKSTNHSLTDYQCNANKVMEEGLWRIGYIYRSQVTQQSYASLAALYEAETNDTRWDAIAPSPLMLRHLLHTATRETFRDGIAFLAYFYYTTFSSSPYRDGLSPDYLSPPIGPAFYPYLFERIQDLVPCVNSQKKHDHRYGCLLSP